MFNIGQLLLIIFCFTIPSLCQEETPAKNDKTLKLIHVIFRHGNRTSELSERYPNDPYLNETYFPIGMGQLTPAGKLKEYQVGKALRRKYNKFLGTNYTPDIIDPWTTNYNRTKASLQLVLSGLFPPGENETWLDGFNWQPIPYNYNEVSEDPILMGVACPRFKKEYAEYLDSPKMLSEFSKYSNNFDYISNASGLNVTVFEDVYDLFFGLATEEEWGFTLPHWTKPVWPKIITDIAIEQYYAFMGTTSLRRTAIGYLLEKVIADTTNKSKNSDSPRKIHMYSAHENTLAQILIALDVFEPHVPTYGSYLVLEVHEIKGIHGIKIYYQNYSTKSPRLLKIPACGKFCPLTKFIYLMTEYLPREKSCGN